MTCNQSWGHYTKNVTSYILLVTFTRCSVLQYYYLLKKVTSYILLATLRAVTSNNITYYICLLQTIK